MMKTRKYVQQRTGYSVSCCHPTAGLVVFNDRRTKQVAVIGQGGGISWTAPAVEDIAPPAPYEEEIIED